MEFHRLADSVIHSIYLQWPARSMLFQVIGFKGKQPTVRLFCEGTHSQKRDHSQKMKASDKQVNWHRPKGHAQGHWSDTGFPVWISHWSHCCGKGPGRSASGRADFGSQSEPPSIVMGRHGTGAWRSRSHVSTVRKRRVMSTSAQLTFSLLFIPDPPVTDGPTQLLGGSFQLN